MYPGRRWRNEEGSNFRTCRYSSIGFRCVWKNAATENSSDSGVSTVSASLAGGKWTVKATRVNQGTNLSPGHRRISRPVGEQLGQDIIRRRIIRRHIIQTRIMIENVGGLLNIREQKQTKGYPKRIPLFTCRKNNTMLY